jgi:hypothetical protein
VFASRDSMLNAAVTRRIRCSALALNDSGLLFEVDVRKVGDDSLRQIIPRRASVIEDYAILTLAPSQYTLGDTHRTLGET